MKKYKVGDTIYIKDTVTGIDYDDLTATYYSDHNGWLDNSCIIDELPAKPVKPVLPKKVADELEITKKLNFSFDNYIARVIVYDKPSYTNSHAFWMNNGDGFIKTLMDAWDNGYTVGAENKYNVKVPHTKDGWYYRDWNSDLRPVQGKEICSEFTEAEIETYGLQDCEKEEVK